MSDSETGRRDGDASLSVTAQALAAAGDAESARDIGALDNAAGAVERKLATVRSSLVERLIYGPAPANDELQSGGRVAKQVAGRHRGILDAALACLADGAAFTADGKLSAELRRAVAEQKAYGFTVPAAYGGLGGTYQELAWVEEALVANGLGALAVEISGELTIGAGSLLAYGDEHQRKTYLPLIAEGALMGFALTEVGVGVNAKKIQAYVEIDQQGDYRLFATEERNKLWITNATYGALLGIVARIGRQGSRIGLFVVQLPQHDVMDDSVDWEFRCESSGVAAFAENFNSRLHFRNFPIPLANHIPADGVEVLFYCLRMGRCMLAAMAAGYQRMLARDASHYAMRRIGVGGRVIKHELPRLALGRMLGGSLQSRALSYLALAQDADGVDLAGLRDITKAAAAQTSLESMAACEHVLGGRSFAKTSRVSAARVNLHLFGIVEGEDDMIRMGMVRDVTSRFVERHLSGLLSVLQRANLDAAGKQVPPAERILRLGLREIVRYPGRSLRAMLRLVVRKEFWLLGAWVVGRAVGDCGRLLLRWTPDVWFERYRALPKPLRHYARYAERSLRRVRWTYLRLSLGFQLQLTSAQIPLQRLGQQIEHLTSIVALCHFSAVQDVSQQRVAQLQSQLLMERAESARLGLSFAQLRRVRAATKAVGDDIESEQSSMLRELDPQPFAHSWES
jgi:alkylation response protein AidB-like acyl-CoA dehydrogenase